MGLFPRLESRSRSEAKAGLDVYNDFWYGLAGHETKSGVTITEKQALKYLTVFSCVSLIAGDIARLPLILYRRSPDGSKERITDHPLYYLLHTAPNPEMNSHLYREASQGHLLLWGNHFSVISRNRYDKSISSICPINDPGAVTVKRDSKRRIVYEFLDADGKRQSLPKDQVFHIPGYGYDGLVGLSMIGLAREAIGVALAAEEFQSKFFGEGTHPSIMVTIPPEINLGDNEEAYRQKLKDTISGLKNAHGIAVFNNGEKVERLTMSMTDAQFLESRDHQKTEICGFYHVPPHKIALHGANSNYNNLEQENQSYVDSCLMHWISRWESCINHQLLTVEEQKSGLFFEFLVDGLLRGDSQVRGEFYNRLFNIGVMSPNDIRSKENMNPVDGGDQRFIPLNMVPMARADEVATALIAGKAKDKQDGNNQQTNT